MTTLHFLSMNMKRGKGNDKNNKMSTSIEDMLIEKKISVFFGQQADSNLKIHNTELLGYIGHGRTCMIYDKSKIVPGDDKKYKQYIRDMELAGVFPKSYLPECNYVLCKMTSQRGPHQPQFQFIAICWVTEEGIGEVRSTSIFRKLCNFIDHLSKWEGLPVIATGTFRITLKDAADLVPPKFHCVGYTPPPKRKVYWFSNFFISSNDMVLQNVGPLPSPAGQMVKPFPEHESPVMATLVILEELRTIEEFCTPVDDNLETFEHSVSEDCPNQTEKKETSTEPGPLTRVKRFVLGIDSSCCSTAKLD